jgi:hypothetical protein
MAFVYGLRDWRRVVAGPSGSAASRRAGIGQRLGQCHLVKPPDRRGRFVVGLDVARHDLQPS